MKRNIGRYFKKSIRIQLGMEWVRGPLKFQLMMTTVTRMDTVFMMNVNNRYLAINGCGNERAPIKDRLFVLYCIFYVYLLIQVMLVVKFSIQGAGTQQVRAKC